MLENPIYAGDSKEFTYQDSTYPATAGYVANLALSNSANAYKVVGTASGDDHLITFDPTATAAWAPARYEWVLYLTNANGARITRAHGTVQVLPDPDSATPTDLRTHARKMLDAIESVLEGRATAGELDLIRIQIFHSRDAQYTPADLIPLRDKYRTEVANEERAAAIARGERISNVLKVRFV